MLFLEIPPFDMLTGQSEPYAGFGDTEVFHSKLPAHFLRTVDIAKHRLKEVFGIHCVDGLPDITAIDSAMSQMWSEGWNPHDANVNLFAADFGSVVAFAIRQSFAGTLVLRSDFDLSHASVWWASKAIEAFPFHATYKKLLNNDGQSLQLFAERIHSILESP